MDDQEYPTGPSPQEKLRDRMFQQRLWIEQLRGTGNSEALKNALTELQRMNRVGQKTDELRPKRRPK
jgi:hypothetical protein